MWTKPKDWTAAQRAKSDELCQRGYFYHLLSPNQRKFHEFMDLPTSTDGGLFCTRKFGKSYSAFIRAIQKCHNNSGFIYRHMLPQLKQSRDVMFRIYDEIKGLLPKSMWPTLNKSEATFYFPATGSCLILGGMQPENIESSRGPLAHELALDEIAAADANNYEYALYSVLFPQLTTTKGKVIHYTTPPKSPAHPWMSIDYPRLKATGRLFEFTIDDNDLLDDSDKQMIEERYGGRDNPNFQREYLLKLVADQDLRVVPEFDTKLHVYSEEPKEVLANIIEGMPPVDSTDYVGYISADKGVVDNTAILAGVLNWRKGILYILQETVLRGRDSNTLSVFADTLIETREYLKQYTEEIIELADMFEDTRNTLHKDYNIYLSRPVKHNLEGNIGVTRSAFEAGKILIHQDCKQLIVDLSHSLWKETASATRSIERSEMTAHADSLMALAYMVRRVNWTRRPASNTKTNPLLTRRR